MKIVWDETPERMAEQLTNQYIAAIQQGVRDIAARRAPEIREWMQANRPWTDRTFKAKSTLDAYAEQVEQYLVELLMQHGVDYGWFLEGYDPRSGVLRETTQGGKFSILMPALDYWGPILMDDIRKFVEG